MSTLKALWHMQGGECFYCGQQAWLQDHGESLKSFQARHGIKTRSQTQMRQATREHLTRKADGGHDGMSNYVMACKGCNNRRGTKPVLLHFSMMRSEHT